MPYKINPKNPKEVMVNKNGKWKVKGKSKSADMAQRYMRALYANMPANEK